MFSDDFETDRAQRLGHASTEVVNCRLLDRQRLAKAREPDELRWLRGTVSWWTAADRRWWRPATSQTAGRNNQRGKLVLDSLETTVNGHSKLVLQSLEHIRPVILADVRDEMCSSIQHCNSSTWRCSVPRPEPSTKYEERLWKTCQKDVFRTTGAQHEDQTGAQDEATEGHDRSQFVKVNLRPREIQREVDFQKKWKSAQRRRKYCALDIARRSQKFSPRRRPPSRGRRTAKI